MDSSWGYVGTAVKKMYGQFGKVPEFVEFDRLLMDAIRPALAGTPLAPKGDVPTCLYCHTPLTGRQTMFCSDKNHKVYYGRAQKRKGAP